MNGPEPADLPLTTEIIIALRRHSHPVTCGTLITQLGCRDQTLYSALRGLKKHGYIERINVKGMFPRYQLTPTGMERAGAIRDRINHLYTGDLP